MRGVSGRDDCAIKIRHLHGSTDISNTHRCAERAILRTGVEFFAVGAQKGRFCARKGRGGEQGPGICRTSCATSLGLREQSNSGRAGTALFAVLRAGPYESELSTALCAERKNAALACSVRIALHCAEREGFEPPEPFSSTVFKTAVIDHSTTSPFPKRDCKYRYFIYFRKTFFKPHPLTFPGYR